MQKNIPFAYKEFVDRALEGGTRVADTLEQARIIANEADGALVIKLMDQYDGDYKTAFLTFAASAEKSGIWMVCGEATFLEPQRNVKIFLLNRRPNSILFLKFSIFASTHASCLELTLCT